MLRPVPPPTRSRARPVHMAGKKPPGYPQDPRKKRWCISCLLFLSSAPDKEWIGNKLDEIQKKYKLIEYEPSSDGDKGTQKFVDFVISFNATAVALYDAFDELLQRSEKIKKTPRLFPGYLKQVVKIGHSAVAFRQSITEYVEWAINSHDALYPDNKAQAFKEGYPITWRPKWQNGKKVATNPLPDGELRHSLS